MALHAAFYITPLSAGTAMAAKEVLTPYKVAVLIFIEKYSDMVLKSGDCSRYEEHLTTRQRKARSMLIYNLIKGDCSFSELCQLIDANPDNKEQAIKWRQSIRQVINEGIEGLQNLFEALSRALSYEVREVMPRFGSTILGVFMRRMNVMYKVLTLNEIVNLHYLVTHYCSSLMQEDQSCLGRLSLSVVDDTLPSALDINMSSPPSSPSLLSTPSCPITAGTADSSLEDTPLPLSEECPGRGPEPEGSAGQTTQPVTREEQSPSCLSASTEIWMWSAKQAEAFIGEQTKLIEFNETMALSPKKLHGVLQQILAAHPDLSAAHYLSCLNYLRVSESRGAVESLAAAYDSQQVTKSTPRSLRYAAINMAALYSHFGSNSVALRCVAEAISQSQEATDNTCLQHALAWLYALSPHSKRESLIQTAVQRTADLQLPYLNWLSLLNQAAHSSGKPPSHHLQMLVSRADGCVGVTGGGAGGYGGVWSVEAGVWGGWLGGCSGMATVCSQLVLHAPPTFIQQPGLSYATSQTATALCSMATALADTGEYGLCQSLLSHTRKLFHSSSPHAKYVRFTDAHVTCTHYTLQGDYTRALSALTPVASERPLYVKIRSCEVAVARGEAESALQQVTELLANEEVKEKPQLLIVVKLLYASALCIANNSEAAIHGLVDTVFLAQENHLALLHSLASLQLLAVQLHLRLLPPAPDAQKNHPRMNNPNIHSNNYYCISPAIDVEMLDMAMAVVLSCGSLYDQARSLLFVAKLRILAASGQQEKLCKVVKDLDRVKNMFVKMEAHHRVRDTLYLSARTLHSAGQVEARNKVCLEFRTLENTHPCMKILPPTPIF